MLRSRVLMFWVSATVTLVALAPVVYVLLQSLTGIDGMHDGEV